MKKILLIEDDQAIQEVMKELLESEGYEVVCASHGEEGLQALRGNAHLPDLILLDMTMPVKDGVQFREEQLRDLRIAAVPVIIMTAIGNIEAKTREVKAQGFIKKPFDLDQVIQIVARTCADL